VLPAQEEPPSGLCGNRTLVGGKIKKEQYDPPCLTSNKEGNRNENKKIYNKYVKKNIQKICKKKRIYNKYKKIYNKHEKIYTKKIRNLYNIYNHETSIKSSKTRKNSLPALKKICTYTKIIFFIESALCK